MESIVDRLTCYQLTIIFGNFASTNSRAPSVFVSCTGCLLSIFSGLLVNDLLTIIIRFVDWSNGDVFTNVQSIDVGFHAFQLLQLCDVDGIGVVCTSGYAVNLAGDCAIRGTNGYGTSSCIPDMGSLICRLSLCCGIIATYLFSRSSSYFRPAADSYAALGADFCVVADGYDVGGCRFIIGGIGRTDDDVVLLIRQFVVVTEDDIGLVLVDAVTSYTVVGTNDVVIFAVSQGILEAIDIVVLSRCT